ncbi:YjhG/YagF family D-xylonate dehydratase [Rhodopirellula sallentina]|uniref:Dihydroxy-acid and 6-phosphogluconate dehydratase n=1 Tax=Rhodopirellula sallentina SM41 TaxID=1263870 RepID=M5U189_9BACT|nr:YjhG/YagF family D-xylonate dehydratase [Rhodopirellula sallentina]EMI55202.1 dihydroxy-acid and 6-phosphogluconate dehydratase [Rhodopirellula sallentina SM41]
MTEKQPVTPLRPDYFAALDPPESFETTADGPAGSLPLSDEILRQWSSGDIFGLTQSVGMGFDPRRVLGDQYLILSTQGGVRNPDGTPAALGYHTGHWEVGLLVRAAAEQIETNGGVPFAAFVSDPCDGRTQGTNGMFDSLPYRNDAAIVMRRLIRSLPQRKGVIGVATCDKGLPAMMMALAGTGHLANVLVPGGVTLPPTVGEDTGKVQTIGARYSRGELSLEDASAAGCRACGTPGGGCQFLGTAATSQVIAEALGMTVPHAALAPSGQPIWTRLARDSAAAAAAMHANGMAMSDVLTEAAFENVMRIHAAVGGSTNLLLHIPAIAAAAGVRRPTVDDFSRVNQRVPRFVDCLPNGPVGHPTVRLFLAGGVPEVALHLHRAGLWNADEKTVSGLTWGDILDAWERSPRREVCRERLQLADGVDPDDVIMSPDKAKTAGLTSTVCFPKGNLCPQGSVIKATSIDPSVVDNDGVYRKRGPARVFTSERRAIEAVKGQTDSPIQPGDVIVLIGRGPLGCGMEETYQITSALKYLSFGKEVALITDARFSGVSTGACIGHVGPEALAGGPIGRIRNGDIIEIEIDRHSLQGHVNIVETVDGDTPAKALATRPMHPDLQVDPAIPDDTRLWAALQQVGGGTWGGCVYDVDRIVATLEAGQRALANIENKGDNNE